mmetsp:Transcript_27772/g.57057  ORF Transcript_27772/g.57057 Transcript_27772/m.57057 type:complete len:234 (+) Transcript_27772:169-870(+)
MMPMRVHSASASSMECVVSTTARFAMVLINVSHKLRRLTGSSPADGSSSSTRSGSPTMAMATHSLRFMPPLRVPASRCAYGPSSSSLTVLLTKADTCAAGTPRRRANSLKWSRHVSLSHSVLCWVTTPRCFEACLKSVSTLFPSISIDPALGYKLRITIEIAVVFPAPLAPSRPKHSPRGTAKHSDLTASRGWSPARLAGKSFRRPLTRREKASLPLGAPASASLPFVSAATD